MVIRLLGCNRLITARVAKRTKVMFSQVFAILSLNGGGGGGGGVTPDASCDRSHGPGEVLSWGGGGREEWTTTSPPPPNNTSALDNSSLPPPWTTLPPPLDNTSLLPPWTTLPSPWPGSKVTTPPPSPPGNMRRQAVRILLECILVYLLFTQHPLKIRADS